MDRAETTSGTRLLRSRWEFRTSAAEPTIRGDLRVAEGATPESAVVICHGFKGFKDWGFFPLVSRTIARHGHAAVSFDLSRSGIGDDGVDFSALDRFAEQTHTRNVEEILAVVEAVRAGRIFPAPLRRIGLFGHSRGGGEAVIAAAEDGSIDALVTWSAISEVDRWSPEQREAWERGEDVLIPNTRTEQQMPIGPAYWADIRRNRARLDIRAAAARLRAPWLIVHGEEDETVPAREASLLHESAGGRSELVLVAGAGHTFGASHPCEDEPPELEAALQATTTWFDTHLANG